MTSKSYRHSSYSEETLSLIEKCMTDLKLTTLQRKAILDDLKNGKPIPDRMVASKIQPARVHDKKNVQYTTKRAKKRKIETMIRCGAYDVPVYVPDERSIDREKEKQRLQDIFYGLDRIPDEEIKYPDRNSHYQPQKVSEKQLVLERMNELMKEIEDRFEFLRSMDEFGLKKKYNFEITNEIAQKVKQLEDLRKSIEKKQTLTSSRRAQTTVDC